MQNNLPDKNRLYDTIIGEMNRISVSDDIEEILQMYEHLKHNSEQYAKACLINNFGKTK